MKAIKTRARNFRLELDFRRAVRRVPRRDRPGLRHWLRTQTDLHSPGPHFAPTADRPQAELPGVAPTRHTRTFYQLDPDTGNWRPL